MTDFAASMMEELRDGSGEYLNMTKGMIADAFTTLAAMLHEGREDQNISCRADELLKVMFCLGDYNTWLNELLNERDDNRGAYAFIESSTPSNKSSLEV